MSRLTITVQQAAQGLPARNRRRKVISLWCWLSAGTAHLCWRGLLTLIKTLGKCVSASAALGAAASCLAPGTGVGAGVGGVLLALGAGEGALGAGDGALAAAEGAGVAGAAGALPCPVLLPPARAPKQSKAPVLRPRGGEAA